MDADLQEKPKYSLDPLECYVLDVEDIQAREAVIEIVKQQPVPGKFICLRKQQFKALKRSCVILKLPQELIDACREAAKAAAEEAVRRKVLAEIAADEAAAAISALSGQSDGIVTEVLSPQS